MNKLTYIFVAFFLTFSLSAQVSEQEKQALIDLYKATNGDQWRNSWNLDEDVAKWHGVTVHQNKVVSIKLMFNNLQGSLPASIGNLTHLRRLELSFNQLQGTIPAEIGNLKQLRVLSFNANNLEGELPATITQLKNLKELHLSSNKLTGSLPEGLTQLSKLTVLNVFDNNFSGDIPEHINQFKNLKQLLVAENNFNYYKAFFLEGMAEQGVAMDIEFTITKKYDGLASTVKEDDEDEDE